MKHSQPRSQRSQIPTYVRFISRCLLVASGLACLSLVAAQTFALRYFELRNLFHTPGVVRLSPDYQTVIEFEGLNVERVSSGRSDQITAEVAGNVIRLRANQAIVNTDLTVTAGGQTALFELKADNRTQTPRIYLVRNQPPTRSPQGPVGTVTDRSEKASTQNQAASPPLTPVQRAAPEGTDFKAVVYHTGQDLVLQYILTNLAGDDLLLDIKRLSIRYGSISLPYTLENPQHDSGQLAEGESAYGTLLITQAPQDASSLAIEWTLFRENSSQQLKLVRSLDAVPIGLPGSTPDVQR